MCPRHLDCYVTCLKEQNDTWVDVPRSRSGGLCMEFPRPEDVSEDNPIDEKEVRACDRDTVDLKSCLHPSLQCEALGKDSSLA